MRTCRLVGAPLVAILASASAANLPTQSIEVRDPSVIAFVPSELDGSQDEGSIEAVAHLRFAVEDTIKCLRPKRLTVHFYYADRISLRNGKANDLLQVHQLGQGVGAILVEPGRRAQVIYSVEGPSTLLYLLPQAAAKYWGGRSCDE